MIRQNLFAGVLACSLLVVGCSTPTKSSNTAFLVGDAAAVKPVAPEKMILADISRSAHLKAKRAWTDQEKKERLNSTEFAETQTTTWLKVYPYTKPLLKARITEMVDQRAYGEKWAPEKVKPEVDRLLASETKRTLEGKQCFAVEANVDDAELMKLDYIHGTITQAGQSYKLTFSKGMGLDQQFATANGAGGYSKVSRYSFADACTTAKLDMTKEFSIVIEPRYKKEILPLSLTWLEATAKPVTITK